MMISDYCIVLLLNCMMCLSCPPALRDVFHTLMARYSLFVLKVQLNTNQLTLFSVCIKSNILSSYSMLMFKILTHLCLSSVPVLTTPIFS